MTTSPIPPAESPKPPVEGKLSAFQEAISKRLRTLRKRLQKIEKYEESPKAELNPDQVLAISRKEMVVFAMKELEELIKQFASIEAEEEELKQKEEEAREAEVLARISDAIVEAKKIPADQIHQLVLMMRCLGDKMDMAEFYTEPAVYEALSYLKEALSSGSSTEIVDHVYKLLSKSLETPFGLAIDYETLFMTLEKLSLAQFTSPLTVKDSVATLKTKTVSKKISFFIPSEILPLEGMVSKEAKPSVPAESTSTPAPTPVKEVSQVQEESVKEPAKKPNNKGPKTNAKTSQENVVPSNNNGNGNGKKSGSSHRSRSKKPAPKASPAVAV